MTLQIISVWPHAPTLAHMLAFPRSSNFQNGTFISISSSRNILLHFRKVKDSRESCKAKIEGNAFKALGKRGEKKEKNADQRVCNRVPEQFASGNPLPRFGKKKSLETRGVE